MFRFIGCVTLLLFTATTFAKGIIPSHCDGSRLILHNKTNQMLTLVNVNDTYKITDRSRGITHNLNENTIIGTGESLTATVESDLFSGSGAWGQFSLIDTNYHLVATIQYSFQLGPLQLSRDIFNSCNAYPKVIFEHPDYVVANNPTIGKPANLDVTVNLK